MQIQYVEQTIDDFRRDRWWWAMPGHLVQGNRDLDPTDADGEDVRVWKVRGARIDPREPVIDMTVVDLGPLRMVRVDFVEQPARA